MQAFEEDDTAADTHREDMRTGAADHHILNKTKDIRYYYE
jgi:hypothetical protein